MISLLKEQVYHTDTLDTMDTDVSLDLDHMTDHVTEGPLIKQKSTDKERTEDLMVQLAQVQNSVLSQQAEQVDGVASTLQTVNYFQSHLTGSWVVEW